MTKILASAALAVLTVLVAFTVSTSGAPARAAGQPVAADQGLQRALPHSAPAPERASGKAACGIYTGCVPTKTGIRVRKRFAVGSRASICVKTVVRNAPGLLPRGRLKISVRFVKGGVPYQATRPYAGGSRCLSTKPLRKKGTYVVRAKFIRSPANSVYLPSGKKKTFVVT